MTKKLILLHIQYQNESIIVSSILNILKKL